MTLTSSPTHGTDRIGDDAQLLFEEARQRRRRRWLITGIILIVTALIGTGIASTMSSTAVKRVRPKPLGLVGSIAISPGGVLYLSTSSQLQYFAFSPSGVLYADNIDESAFSRYQKIVSFDNGKTTELWGRRVRD